MQDCIISIANGLEILQSCTKPSIWQVPNTSEQTTYIKPSLDGLVKDYSYPSALELKWLQTCTKLSDSVDYKIFRRQNMDWLVTYRYTCRLWFKTHPRQWNCWSLRCSWRCRRCSNYIFILDLTPGLIGFGKDDFKTKWESFKFWHLVCPYGIGSCAISSFLKNVDSIKSRKLHT